MLAPESARTHRRLVLWRRAALLSLFSLALFLVLSAVTTPLPPGQQGGQRETVVNFAELRAIEANLRGKYRKVDSLTVEPGPPDQAGVLFFVTGDLRPPEEQLSKSGYQMLERDPEASATLFVRNEAEFLGMTEPNEELRQRTELEEKDGKVHIFFDKYIAGLRIDQVDIRVHVNPDGSVFAFNGYLVSVPLSVKSAVAAAARSTHIPQERVRTAIADDMGFGVTFTMKAEKVVIPTEPYVVWKADVTLQKGVGRWMYTMDAFTGRIMSKRDYLRYNRGPKQ